MFEVGDTTRPQDALDQLHAKLDTAIELQDTIAMLEDSLKAAKGSLHEIASKEVPEILGTLQMDEITYKGWNVKVAEIVSGSLPKEEHAKQKAINWLKDHEAEGLIKTTVSADFGKGEHNMAGEILAAMNKAIAEIGLEDLEGKMDMGVHPQTLQAFARERLANGEDIDTETLGLYIAQVAKFKKEKAKK